MLEEFGANIWLAQGPVVTAAAGFHYPTRMVAIRLSGGNMVLWSPTALSKVLRAEVEALGAVRYLVAPNSLHHTFLAEWQQAFPEARMFAPPGLRKIRRDIRFSDEFGDAPVPDWDGEIDHVVMRGNRITTEVVLFHRQSRSAIFADLLQQFPHGWFKGWRAVIARLDLMVTDRPSVPRKFRLAFTDRQSARTSIQRVLSWPAEKVLMAHGEPVTIGGKAFLEQTFSWLADS